MRIAILVIFLACIGPVWAEQADGAASNLISSQNPDGSWGSADKGSDSKTYTTARVLQGLMHYGEESDVVDRGVEWIELQDPEDAAALAEVLRVLHMSGASAESRVLKLKENQNADGGWGKTAGFESTPWYTASAIIALSPFEGYRDASITGGEYLIDEQGEDGGFEDSALITSNCVYALVLLYDATKRDEFAIAALRGYEWLNITAGVDGAWDSVTSTSNSVIALKALFKLTGDEDVGVLIDNAKEWIIASPESSGDPMPTAWALSALTQDTAVSPAKSMSSISASLTEEYVFPQDVTEIKFKIENRGLASMKNVSLLLVTPKELSAEIGKTGWEIETLKSGEAREFSEVISISGEAVEGEYPIMITGGSMSAAVTLHVLESPLVFEISPTELKNDAPTDFKIKVRNMGQRDFSIKSIAMELDENWRDVELSSVQLEVPSGSEESFVLFSALAPEERGEYNVPVAVEFVNPELGERQITFRQKFLVGGGVPSGVLKLVLYGTLVLSVMMLLNLLLGYDLLG